MKFVLFVEGDTEHKVLSPFIRRWLDKRLDVNIGVQVVKFTGWPELVKEAPKKAGLHLKRQDVIAVIGLLDLHSPGLFPNHLESVEERQSWGKEDIQKEVGQERYRQHFAVHEIEAWLLSNPDIFPEKVRRALPGKVKAPESINSNEPPSKLLVRLYREKANVRYKKTVNGIDLFSKLDPEIAYEKCPALRNLLDELLHLAEKAISE